MAYRIREKRLDVSSGYGVHTWGERFYNPPSPAELKRARKDMFGENRGECWNTQTSTCLCVFGNIFVSGSYGAKWFVDFVQVD